MNADKFKNEIESQLSSNSIDIAFLGKWFDRTLDRLKTLSSQKSAISHPRHRGDARETDIKYILNEVFPSTLTLQKGFVLNRHTTVSREQDIIITNGDTAGSLVRGGDASYYPIEACLASIEVKSNLTLTELRKCIINCISVKKLLYGDAYTNEREEGQAEEYCYAIFAYRSHKNLQKTATQVNSLLADVPHHLRPNLIYILGKGLLIPGSESGLEIKYDQMFVEREFTALARIGTSFIKDSEAYAFLWFVTSIIDHCINESLNRKPPPYLSYVLSPLLHQIAFERQLMEEHPEKFNKIIANRAKSGH